MKITPEQEKIQFKATVRNLESWLILELPKSVSARLPSRGLVMVQGTLNEFPFQTPLEPDGKGSHWFRIDKRLMKATGVKTGDTVALFMTPIKDWPEPELPEDLKKALTAAREVYRLWLDITPMARWDWIRWIRSTKEPETRKRRIEVACSKLKAGSRRPCCFNRNLCSEPSVSNKGILH